MMYLYCIIIYHRESQLLSKTLLPTQNCIDNDNNANNESEN